VVDLGNHRLQRFGPDGTPTTLLDLFQAAMPFAGGMQAVAVGAQRTIYLSAGIQVLKLAPDGMLDHSWLPKVTFTDITALATDAHGNLYVGDEGAHRVVELTADGVQVRIIDLPAETGIGGIVVGQPISRKVPSRLIAAKMKRRAASHSSGVLDEPDCPRGSAAARYAGPMIAPIRRCHSGASISPDSKAASMRSTSCQPRPRIRSLRVAPPTCS
jgi:hypothetical protein